MSSELRNASVLVLGQAMTSRTETVEEYLRYRCRQLATIGLAGVHQRFRGRCTLCKEGEPVSAFSLPSLSIGGSSTRCYLPRIFLYYLLQPFAVIFSALRLRVRFHFVLGISTFYAFMGILLKRLRFADHVVYYSIDYYPQRTFVNVVFRRLDRFCVENSDAVWNLTPTISEARRVSLRGELRAPTEIVVPLTYGSGLLTLRPLDEIDRWSIAFVGTLERLQGLQLLVEAMPEILSRLSEVHVRVVGDGPYAGELKRLVREAGLDDRFIFYGFVKRDSDVVAIVSRCAIGLAPFVPTPENNAMTADPGKIKFYAFLGLPVVVTKIPSGLIVDRSDAGIAVEYDSHELANAVVKLLSEDRLLTRYRHNANLFAQSYTSERVFPGVFEATLQSFGQD